MKTWSKYGVLFNNYNKYNMKLIYKFIILIIIFPKLLYLYFIDKPKVIYKSELCNEDLKGIIDKKIDVLVIKGYFDNYVDKIAQHLELLKLDQKSWRGTNKDCFDVKIIQIPLSDYFNGLCSFEEYISQKGIIGEMFKNVGNPFDKLKADLPKYKILIGKDPILSKSCNFQPCLVRFYNGSMMSGDGLKHVDTDDTGLYKDYSLLSLNIYLNTFQGGELKFWKNIFNSTLISPKKGDLIIMNPNYYHSVKKTDSMRISLQSFMLSNGEDIYIRN